jgi:hypothetical protein
MQPLKGWLVRICLLGFLCSAASATGPRSASPFVIFETSDAPGTLDSKKLSECLQLTLREMNLDGRELPRIAVYHISAEAGHHLGIETNSNWRSSGGGHPRYEMWIVGKPSNSLFTYMLENILERHFQLQVDEAARSRIVIHIERGLDATVDARSFR